MISPHGPSSPIVCNQNYRIEFFYSSFQRLFTFEYHWTIKLFIVDTVFEQMVVEVV